MTLRICLLGACAVIATAAAAQTTAPMPAGPPVSAIAEELIESRLPIGTPITFSMDHALATDERKFEKGEKKPDKQHRRITNVGDKFTMTVANDVKVANYVVIPKGSPGTGEVTMVTGRGSFGKSGKIEVRMNTVTVGDRTFALEGTHLQKGKGRGGAAVAGTILAGAIAGAFIKGDEADIPVNALLTFRTKEAIVFKAPKSMLAAPAADASPPAAPKS